MASVIIHNDFEAQENSLLLFSFFPHLLAMKWWDQIYSYEYSIECPSVEEGSFHVKCSYHTHTHTHTHTKKKKKKKQETMIDIFIILIVVIV